MKMERPVHEKKTYKDLLTKERDGRLCLKGIFRATTKRTTNTLNRRKDSVPWRYRPVEISWVFGL